MHQAARTVLEKHLFCRPVVSTRAVSTAQVLRVSEIIPRTATDASAALTDANSFETHLEKPNAATWL